MTTLTKAQKLALFALAKHVSWHVSEGIDSRTLAALKDKGLAEFGYDTINRQYVERITPNGYELAKKLGYRRRQSEAVE